MNYIENDEGNMVVVEGSPGSLARVSVERPCLIRKLNALYTARHDSYGRGVDEAIECIRAAGIKSRLETTSLLKASYYATERDGSVTSLVCRIK